MAAENEFVTFQRGDGSPVACQISRILFVSKGDHGAILNFGSGTVLNVRTSFEDVVEMLGGSPAG